jgi:hypothetical protein
MQAVPETSGVREAGSRRVTWRGRSGRAYAFRAERMETFALDDDSLHLLAIGPHMLWAGTARDLVDSAESRARFRLAMSCADRVYRVEMPFSDGDQMLLLWDLEGALPDPDEASRAA